MPEYHQIEIYIDINQDLLEAINRFGWLDDYVEEWLDKCTWEVSDDGFVYSSGDGSSFRAFIQNESFDIRLTFLGWTSIIFPKLKTNYIELEILFETEKIDDQTNSRQIRYKKKAEVAVWYLIQQAITYFPDYGVFFTDEFQDGKPWQGIIENDPTKCWLFELGIVDNQQKHHFIPIRTEFSQKKLITNYGWQTNHHAINHPGNHE